MNITRPFTPQILHGEQQLDQYLAERGATADPHFRSVAGVIPYINPDMLSLIATYGYSTLYPQALAFDEVTGEIFILRNSPSGGANAYGWIFVYDGTTLELKRTFSLGANWSECLVIRWIGAVRYAYTIDGTGGNIVRMDITTLPVNLSIGSPTSMGVTGYTMMTFDGVNFAVQNYESYAGGRRRNRWTVYRGDFSARVGFVEFPLDGTGDLGAYLDLLPKAQSIAAFNGGYAVAYGSVYVEGTDNPYQQSLQSGIQLFSVNGDRTASGLERPDLARPILDGAAGYAGNMIENEGLATFGGELYALWVNMTPTMAALPENAGRGIVITKELSSDPGRVDFRSAATLAASFNRVQVETASAQNASAQITNPITKLTINNFADIVAYMRGAGLSRYAFAGTGQTITDLLGASVPVSGAFVTCSSTNGATFLIDVEALVNEDCRRYWLHTNGTVQVNLTHPRCTNRTTGKTWAALGDSITQAAAGYVGRVAGSLGLVPTNFGLGGAQMTYNAGLTAPQIAAGFSRVTGGAAMASFDVITVAFGTNDAYTAATMGVLGSVNEAEFYGAMAVGYANILAANPDALVIFILPIYREMAPGDAAVDPYRVAIRAFCASKKLPFFEAGLELGINTTTQAAFLSDTLHPNAVGQDRMGRYVAGKITSIM